ncbi:MAG: M24 family metallopeptidase, partial [Pseudomonadota bacterium]
MDSEAVKTGRIKIHAPEDFDGMRKAGRLAAACLDMAAGLVEPGVTTASIDDKIRAFVFDQGAVPATLGYRGYR